MYGKVKMFTHIIREKNVGPTMQKIDQVFGRVSDENKTFWKIYENKFWPLKKYRATKAAFCQHRGQKLHFKTGLTALELDRKRPKLTPKLGLDR